MKRSCCIVFFTLLVCLLFFFPLPAASAEKKRKITNLAEEIAKFEKQLKKSGDEDALKEWNALDKTEKEMALKLMIEVDPDDVPKVVEQNLELAKKADEAKYQAELKGKEEVKQKEKEFQASETKVRLQYEKGEATYRTMDKAAVFWGGAFLFFLSTIRLIAVKMLPFEVESGKKTKQA